MSGNDKGNRPWTQDTFWAYWLGRLEPYVEFPAAFTSEQRAQIIEEYKAAKAEQYALTGLAS